MRRAAGQRGERPPQCPECGSFRTTRDGLMDAIARAAVQAPDAPRDVGRPLPFYACRNCWHTFTVACAALPDGEGGQEAASDDRL